MHKNQIKPQLLTWLCFSILQSLILECEGETRRSSFAPTRKTEVLVPSLLLLWVVPSCTYKIKLLKFTSVRIESKSIKREWKVGAKDASGG